MRVTAVKESCQMHAMAISIATSLIAPLLCIVFVVFKIFVVGQRPSGQGTCQDR
jgi:hypothetical protein